MKNSCMLRAPISSVPSGNPNRLLFPTRLRTILGARRRGEDDQMQTAQEEQHSQGLQGGNATGPKCDLHKGK
jgi:hypothetical protein